MLCSWGCTDRRFRRLEAEKRSKKENTKQKMKKSVSEKKKSVAESKKKIDQYCPESEYEKPHNASKAVLQFDMDGNFIKRHNSVRDAANSIGKGCSTLSKCLSGNYRNQSFGGFLWRYEKGFDTGNDEY
jgi:hypothetical protein